MEFKREPSEGVLIEELERRHETSDPQEAKPWEEVWRELLEDGQGETA